MKHIDRNKRFNKFVKTINIEDASEKLKLLTMIPDDTDGIFNTWAVLSFERQDILEDLQLVNKSHIKLVRCSNTLKMLANVLHYNGKPTKVGLRVLYWLNKLENKTPVQNYFKKEYILHTKVA